MRAWQGWLAPGATWAGSATFDGPVFVGGMWKGDLRCADWVEVAEGAHVEGSVEAMAVLVGGRVSGGIRAQERICLLPTAVVTGELRAPWLDVRLGARWAGRASVERP